MTSIQPPESNTSSLSASRPQRIPSHPQHPILPSSTATSTNMFPNSPARFPSRTRPYPSIPSQFYSSDSQTSPKPSNHNADLPPLSTRNQQTIPIPSAIPPIAAQQDSTPLPMLPILVLCFAMISEFLSASVSGPFIFFMIEDFGVGGGEAAVGFWAGIVSSVFFFSQFLTSLLWSNVSNKHGRRIVLFSSLLGNAITLILFGSSTSLGMAICARLGQGLFNGAIGVARGAVRDLTDSTNEGRAIAWIGLCWGMGGITGPIIGGLLEHPAENYPALFGRFQLLKDYPYLLPCAVASSITFTGAILSLFLGWDGGYRTGKIHLSDSTKLDAPGTLLAADQDDNDQTSQFQRNINPLRSPHLHIASIGYANSPTVPTMNIPKNSAQSVIIRNPVPMSRSSTMQTSAFAPGSSYGYDRTTTLPHHRLSNWRDSAPRGSVRSNSYTLNRRTSRTISLARSFADGTQYAPDYDEFNREENTPTLNFAQRLLLANEDAVFGLHDVWLAAATTQERDDEYSQIDDSEQPQWNDDSIFEDDDAPEVEGFEDQQSISELGSFDERGRAFMFQEQQRLAGNQRLRSVSSRRQSHGTTGRRGRFGTGISPRRSYVGADGSAPSPSTTNAGMLYPWQEQKLRTVSMASSIRPAIFSNTGLATPPSMSHPPPTQQSRTFANPVSVNGNLTTCAGLEPLGGSSNLGVIHEGHRTPGSDSVPTSQETTLTDTHKAMTLGDTSQQEEMEKPHNLFEQLPLAIIAQYAIVALHGTTCDQLFMSFLVTPIRSGGLGLSAGHYAELIAAMCIAQIVFQFRFYPTVGPPRGQLTHLSMFRLGLCLYIPVYLLLPELRGLLRENHNGLVMFGMILLCSFRWLANVCAYTSVMVMS